MNKAQNAWFDKDLRKLESYAVENTDRPKTLASHFGNQCLVFENKVYNWTTILSKDYTGGYWEFYNLSNGGFYMAPKTDKTFYIINPMNGFTGHMGYEAVGISVCCLVFSDLSFDFQINPVWADRFYQLRAFAMQHTEAISITRLID